MGYAKKTEGGLHAGLGGSRVLVAMLAVLVIMLVPTLGRAGTIRVSVSSAGAEATNHSQNPSVSSDGRYVAFFSLAGDLVAGDTNAVLDVFVHDAVTGATTRVSVSSLGDQATLGHSRNPSITGDGRYVAFESSSLDLVTDKTTQAYDIFVHDRNSGQTARISLGPGGVEGNSNSDSASISDDGNMVAFASTANNLVAGDTNGAQDIFVRDLLAGATMRASLSSAGAQAERYSAFPVISGSGRYVAFYTNAGNLVGVSGAIADIVVRDLLTDQTTLVSQSTAGERGDGGSWSPAISHDGRYVAFESMAGNLVSGVSGSQIYVRDLVAGQTTLASINSNGEAGNGGSYNPSISGDGRYVAFESSADNLVTCDTNKAWDIFVHDRQTGRTFRASLASSGVQAGMYCHHAALSGDGRAVAFYSTSDNLVAGDTNGVDDVFLRDQWDRKAMPVLPFMLLP